MHMAKKVVFVRLVLCQRSSLTCHGVGRGWVMHHKGFVSDGDGAIEGEREADGDLRDAYDVDF